MTPEASKQKNTTDGALTDADQIRSVTLNPIATSMAAKASRHISKQRLEAVCRDMGISKTYLAKASDCKLSTFCRWVDGSRCPPPGFRETLEKYLRLPQGALSEEVQS